MMPLVPRSFFLVSTTVLEVQATGPTLAKLLRSLALWSSSMWCADLLRHRLLPDTRSLGLSLKFAPRKRLLCTIWASLLSQNAHWTMPSWNNGGSMPLSTLSWLLCWKCKRLWLPKIRPLNPVASRRWQLCPLNSLGSIFRVFYFHRFLYVMPCVISFFWDHGFEIG